MKFRRQLLDGLILVLALAGCATTHRDPWDEAADPSRWASQPPGKPLPCNPSFGDCARNHPEMWPTHPWLPGQLPVR